MTDRMARGLVLLQVIFLLVGTLMPGAWRNGVEQAIEVSLPVSSLAHFVLFTGMALVLAVRPLAWPVVKILLLALSLAVTTEGLQFFALDRHPRLLDVGIDMAGSFFGLALVKGRRLCTVRP